MFDSKAGPSRPINSFRGQTNGNRGPRQRFAAKNRASSAKGARA